METNAKLAGICPHFAICTKLADLRHTYKSLRKLLRSENESPEPQKLIERKVACRTCLPVASGAVKPTRPGSDEICRKALRRIRASTCYEPILFLPLNCQYLALRCYCLHNIQMTQRLFHLWYELLQD